MRLVLDQARCSSLGMCEAVAPEVFEVGEDGALTVLDPTPPDDNRELMQEAVDACPTSALSIEG